MKPKVSEIYKVDSYDIKQYENERVVDVVRVIEIQKGFCLCHSPLLRANVLIKKDDLREVKR